MIAHAPIEIWEKILKYAISVPLFFDSDPISNHGIKRFSEYQFEAEYWQSERIRNRLRRVCKSWNIFLRVYQHRYVTLTDLHNGEVPLSALLVAIRLNFSFTRSYPASLRSIPRKFVLQDVRRLLKKIIRSASGESTDVDAPTRWSVQIIDDYEAEDISDLTVLPKIAPRLEAVIGVYASDLTVPLSITNNLVSLYMNEDYAASRACKWPISYFPHLTSLRLRPVDLEIPLDQWNLPALQHLSIDPIDPLPSTDAVAYFQRIIEVFGRQLITFYYNVDCGEFEVPNDFWSYIPRLQHIQLPHWGEEGPPANHPLKHVRVPVCSKTSADIYWTDPPAPAATSFPYWEIQSPANLRHTSPLTVQLDQPWIKITMTDFRGRRFKNRIFDLVAFYDNRGTILIDSAGLTLYEYLVFAIKTYWKGGRGTGLQRRSQTFNSEMVF
ncbi:hypothetical protein M408DRAFT_31042 [Serendipita vermifera MAFF 305830]|uniref:F-box domain-containing protein n=1 Tax=Serendipita vermifera MAFF 305830 TaxID=933852 RepID=A0A0C3AK38_SERVB|nr:hypothetical protein M408DRAFT_31042 [Serendipita vermifera MAFF 305830]